MSRTIVVVSLVAAMVFSLAGSPLAQQAPGIEDELLNEKCSFCPSSKRILRLEPSKIKETVERMRKMNPDWISTIQSDDIAEVIATVANDTNVIAQRKAWNEALERGEKIFNDTSLGKTGKACASCHAPVTLRNIADSYPQWDVERKRFVTLNETINRMVESKLGAEPFSRNDQSLFDLIAYLKSL